MKFQARLREYTGKKVKKLQKEGYIPAVLYGKGIKNINLAINMKDFTKAYKIAGENTLLELDIENDKTGDRNVLVHDVNTDPVNDSIIHVDFYQVDMKQKVIANVPLVFEGESQAVKVEAGVLIKNLHEVEVSALPKDLPHEIKVDLSLLASFNDVISIKDLKVPQGVKIDMHEDEVIASVARPRSQEELEALSEKATTPDVSEVKVETELKKEERAKEKEKEQVEK